MGAGSNSWSGTLFPDREFSIALPKRRFSIHPLLDKFGSAAALATATGRSERQVERWIAEGVTYVQADEIATRSGENPETVWPDWEIDDLQEEDMVAGDIRLDPEKKPIAAHVKAQPMVDDLSRLVVVLTTGAPIPGELQALHEKALKAGVGDDWDVVEVDHDR